MQLRPFGKRSGLEVAPISMGAMRFPADGLDAVELIRHAIDSGMRYIDTSRGYGESEFILSRALKDGYREKVILSTKSSPWILKWRDDDDGSADSIRRRIDEQLVRLDVDYLDFYQVWNIHNKEGWEIATKPGGMVEGIRKAMDEGLVRHTGFTSHDEPEQLLEKLPQCDWAEVILVSYNLLQLKYAPVMRKAKELGIGVIVMNPIGGGKFAQVSPVLEKLAGEVGAESVPDLALRFVLSNPDVDTIVSGINRKSDVDSTIASAEQPAFSAEQMQTIHKFFQDLSRENVGFCTACNYCMPCPEGIDIPRIMALIYDERFLGMSDSARDGYKQITGPKADACEECGACEDACTQNLQIMAELAYAAREYATPG